MARSVRVLRRGVQGRQRNNHNFGPITEKSAVIVTAGQFNLSGGIFGLEGRYHLGDADVWVTNVGPHDDEGGGAGGVEFHLHTNSAEPIDVMVTITVLDDVEDIS